MNSPWTIGSTLPDAERRALRLRTIFDCCKWDVQSEDHSVLAPFPLLLERPEWEKVSRLAEQLSREALAAEEELVATPALHSELGLPRAIRKLLQHSAGAGHPCCAARVMRFDFHFTTQGWRISEVNADVPGGFIEASGFTQLMAAHYADTAPPPNAAQAYASAIVRHTGRGALVALVHATAHSDDRQVMEYLGRILRASGVKTCFLSPAHLRWRSGRAEIRSAFAGGVPDMIVRFFPAEWLPALGNRDVWSSYFRTTLSPMSNPGTALLIQSKRFPLAWERLATALPTWRATLPEVRSPEDIPAREFCEWVLKPALGRVGEDVGMEGITADKEWKRICSVVRRHPSGWIAQRRFDIVPVTGPHDDRHIPHYPCLGVFTIDSRAAGAYGRISTKCLIDGTAQDVAVLLHNHSGVN